MKVRAPGFRIGTAYSVAFSTDGEHLAAVGRDVVIWSVSRRKRLRSNRMLAHPSSVSFSPSGRMFAVKNTRGEILVCETASADPVSRFLPPSADEGPALAFRGETEIVDGAWAGQVRRRFVNDLAPLVVWQDSESMVGAVAHAAATDLWAFSAVARTMTTDRPPREDCIFLSNGLVDDSFTRVRGSWPFLRDIALAPDGHRLAIRAGATEHTIAVLETASGAQLAKLRVSQGGTGWGLSWSPDASTIVLVEDGGFSFRRSRDLKEIGWLPMEYPASVAFAPDGSMIGLGTWGSGIVAPWPELLQSLDARSVESLPPAP